MRYKSPIFWVNLGSDIDATSKTGVTALMYAASAGELAVVKLLLARGRSQLILGQNQCTFLYAICGKSL